MILPGENRRALIDAISLELNIPVSEKFIQAVDLILMELWVRGYSIQPIKDMSDASTCRPIEDRETHQ